MERVTVLAENRYKVVEHDNRPYSRHFSLYFLACTGEWVFHWNYPTAKEAFQAAKRFRS